jgi:hypothetical protein
MTASASSLSELALSGAPLDGFAPLDALVDAALARRLTFLCLEACQLSPASAPAALACLLCDTGARLTALGVVNNGGGPLLLSADPAAALLADAFRQRTALAAVTLSGVGLWHNADAAEMMLRALTAHPSLRWLVLSGNAAGAAAGARARAGAALGALVAANAPALEQLTVSGCALGDEGLAPLVDALAANTHLRMLDCSDNAMSDAFALRRLQPALHAHPTLRYVRLVGDAAAAAAAASPALRQLQRATARRHAFQNAGVSPQEDAAVQWAAAAAINVTCVAFTVAALIEQMPRPRAVDVVVVTAICAACTALSHALAAAASERRGRLWACVFGVASGCGFVWARYAHMVDTWRRGGAR